MHMHDETPMTTPDTPAGAQDARDLDRTIAERLGYRQNGDLWEYDTPHGFPAVVEGFPHYSTDLNAALSLVDAAQPAYFTLSYSPDRMNWRAEFTFDYRRFAFADAREPAEAVCRAWLEWQDTPAPRAADADGRRSGGE